MDIVYGILEQGLVFGLIGIAVFLTLRVVDFPDMGINNSFTLGGASWYFAIKHGMDPYSASIIAFFVGFIIGYITASFNLFFHIRSLLAGIITMIALYSINMRLMGKPNIPLISENTLFGDYNDLTKIIIISCIVIIIWISLSIFFISEIGLGIRISGSNYMLGETYGISKTLTIGTTVGLSNGIVAFAGALLSQAQGFIDINMGNGLIIIGLVSVIIGERIFATRNISGMLFMSIIGAIAYKTIVVMALFSSDIGLIPSDIYIITALIIVSMMIIKKHD